MRSRGQTVTSCTTAPRPAGPGRPDPGPGECLCSNGTEINSSSCVLFDFIESLMSSSAMISSSLSPNSLARPLPILVFSVRADALTGVLVLGVCVSTGYEVSFSFVSFLVMPGKEEYLNEYQEMKIEHVLECLC